MTTCARFDRAGRSWSKPDDGGGSKEYRTDRGHDLVSRESKLDYKSKGFRLGYKTTYRHVHQVTYNSQALYW